MAATLQQLREQVPTLADDLLNPMLQFLQVARDTCGGDLEMNIILLAISVRTVAHPDFPRIAQEERLSEEPTVFPSKGVNVRSIAESSGIPRETVRRKVGELVEVGWIARHGAALHLTSVGYRALTPAREVLEDMARLYYLAVSRRLSRPDPSSPQ